jgi:hypothetical protein
MLWFSENKQTNIAAATGPRKLTSGRQSDKKEEKNKQTNKPAHAASVYL